MGRWVVLLMAGCSGRIAATQAAQDAGSCGAEAISWCWGTGCGCGEIVLHGPDGGVSGVVHTRCDCDFAEATTLPPACPSGQIECLGACIVPSEANCWSCEDPARGKCLCNTETRVCQYPDGGVR